MLRALATTSTTNRFRTGIHSGSTFLEVHFVLEGELQERHPDVKAVLCLPEIRCPRVCIHIRCDLHCKHAFQ